MRITIEEIANMAGVSKTTVSRVLNNKPDVRSETRVQIQDLIAKFDFRPNAMARAISTQKSRSIGFLIPHEADYIFSNPFFVDVMRGISIEVDRSGYFLMLCYPHDQNYLDIYQQKRVDGFILLSPGLQQNEMVSALNGIEAPFVSTSIQESDNAIPNVDVDNFASGVLAVEHLVSLGHKKIAYLGKFNQASHDERLKGYKSVLSRNDIPIQGAYIIQMNDTSIRAGSIGMERFLKIKEPPTAVFAVSDMLAIGAIQKILEVGMKIPDDFSIIGFDDIPLAEYTTPPLTTIRQPAYEKGVQAARMLIQYLEDKVKPVSQTLEVKLIVRGSTTRITPSIHSTR